MNFAGRMYQNPDKEDEIWLTIGNYTDGEQKYPDYEPSLAPYVSSEQYDELIRTIKDQFEDAPMAERGSPMFFLQMFCCCFCTKRKIDEFNEQLDNTVDSLEKKLGFNIKFKLIQLSEPCDNHWLDSRGNKLLQYGPGGPPVGCNIVLKLPDPVSWPPNTVPSKKY